MLPTLVTWTTHFIDAGTLQFSPSTARHVQLVTELYLYRLRIFNKIEVSRLDSTLSLFVIIRTYKLYQGSSQSQGHFQVEVIPQTNFRYFDFYDKTDDGFSTECTLVDIVLFTVKH